MKYHLRWFLGDWTPGLRHCSSITFTAAELVEFRSFILWRGVIISSLVPYIYILPNKYNENNDIGPFFKQIIRTNNLWEMIINHSSKKCYFWAYISSGLLTYSSSEAKSFVAQTQQTNQDFCNIWYFVRTTVLMFEHLTSLKKQD